MRRPQHEEEGLQLNETTMLARQGTRQFEFDTLLNELAELVRKSALPWGNRMLLLHGIGVLRGYVHSQTRRMVAEPQGRCN